VFVTRLHARYDAAGFPEDLMFRETANRQNFQGRFVIRNAWHGVARCALAEQYLNVELPARREREARTLASLTGWSVAEIRARLPFSEAGSSGPQPWWKKLWPEFSRLIRQRDGHCLMDGYVPFHFCYAHHIHWWHKNPVEAYEWARQHLGPRWLLRLDLERQCSYRRKRMTEAEIRAEWNAFGLGDAA